MAKKKKRLKKKDKKFIKALKNKRKKQKKKRTKYNKQINYQIVELDNKSRKGRYIYIYTSKKGARYYKHYPDLNKKDYIRAYNYGIKVKRKGARRDKRKLKKAKKVIKKYPDMESLLLPGYAQYTIKDASKLTPRDITLAYERLLRNSDKIGKTTNILKDKKLSKLVTLPENVEKWKKRLMYKISLKNEKGDILIEIGNSNKKTLAEIKKEVLDKIQIGEEFKSQYQTFKHMKSDYRIGGGQTQEGIISKVEVRIQYRKGIK